MILDHGVQFPITHRIDIDICFTGAFKLLRVDINRINLSLLTEKKLHGWAKTTMDGLKTGVDSVLCREPET